ncbi:hypothetical protein GQX74_009860 [Glossina fuscipes]|nr:hypothetical protein GQX74_009860 [Glossina fuscipes]
MLQSGIFFIVRRGSRGSIKDNIFTGGAAFHLICFLNNDIIRSEKPSIFQCLSPIIAVTVDIHLKAYMALLIVCVRSVKRLDEFKHKRTNTCLISEIIACVLDIPPPYPPPKVQNRKSSEAVKDLTPLDQSIFFSSKKNTATPYLFLRQLAPKLDIFYMFSCSGLAVVSHSRRSLTFHFEGSQLSLSLPSNQTFANAVNAVKMEIPQTQKSIKAPVTAVFAGKLEVAVVIRATAVLVVFVAFNVGESLSAPPPPPASKELSKSQETKTSTYTALAAGHNKANKSFRRTQSFLTHLKNE